MGGNPSNPPTSPLCPSLSLPLPEGVDGCEALPFPSHKELGTGRVDSLGRHAGEGRSGAAAPTVVWRLRGGGSDAGAVAIADGTI